LPDTTVKLLHDGYRFIGNQCDALETDSFFTRLVGRRALCLRGESASAFFYDGNRFTRSGAMPPTTVRLLQDLGSVQTLDDEAHHHRKALFRSILDDEVMQSLALQFDDAWTAQSARWQAGQEINLLHESRRLLTIASCRWAGIPESAINVAARTAELGAMVDGAGSFGPKLVRGLLRRQRTERWATSLIERQRTAPLAEDDTPLAVLAAYRDEQGRELPSDIAAVELINLLRPTVAVSNFIVFAALALQSYPEMRAWLLADRETRLVPFVQEVRRYYPFFPFVAGVLREADHWQGHRLEAGTWVILDLYGTNHHPDLWTDPDLFQPQRFVEWVPNPYTLIPQGAGDYDTGHRCPGEPSTITLIATAVERLLDLPYAMPPQDLTLRFNQFPALPRSGFKLIPIRPELIR
jgi:fatty-acid peroxygenase